MPKQTSNRQNEPKVHRAHNPIEMDLQFLEAKARKSGYSLVAHLIGVAALAARDEDVPSSSIAAE